MKQKIKVADLAKALQGIETDRQLTKEIVEDALKEALISAIEMLNVNGRVVVITFQSLEDRIVKNIFRDYSVIEGNRNNDYINPKDLKTPDYRLVNKKVILPSAEEIEVNRRSKSAKMRIIEKIK